MGVRYNARCATRSNRHACCSQVTSMTPEWIAISFGKCHRRRQHRACAESLSVSYVHDRLAASLHKYRWQRGRATAAAADACLAAAGEATAGTACTQGRGCRNAPEDGVSAALASAGAAVVFEPAVEYQWEARRGAESRTRGLRRWPSPGYVLWTSSPAPAAASIPPPAAGQRGHSRSCAATASAAATVAAGLDCDVVLASDC